MNKSIDKDIKINWILLRNIRFVFQVYLKIKIAKEFWWKQKNEDNKKKNIEEREIKYLKVKKKMRRR